MEVHVLSISVGGIGHFGTAGEIVQPIQTWLLCDRVHSAEQQIHIIRLPAAQRSGEFTPDKACDSTGAEVGLVAHGVQGDVGLNVLSELDGVAWFTGKREKRMLVELAGLVVGRLEDGGAAHGGFAGGDDSEVAACKAQKDFPRLMSIEAKR